MTAVEQLNCGIYGRDAYGITIFANQRLLGWLGYTLDEIKGHSGLILLPPELGGITAKEMHLREAGDCRARLTVLRRKDSTTFPVLSIPQQIKPPVDKETHYYSIIVDLATVQTAKPAGYSGGGGGDLRSHLDRIAVELQTLGLAAEMAETTPVPLEHPDLVELTPREKDVLAALMRGDRVPGIAESLHISPHTVRNHLKSIYRQLGVAGQAELIGRVRSLTAKKD